MHDIHTDIHLTIIWPTPDPWVRGGLTFVTKKWFYFLKASLSDVNTDIYISSFSANKLISIILMDLAWKISLQNRIL